MEATGKERVASLPTPEGMGRLSLGRQWGSDLGSQALAMTGETEGQACEVLSHLAIA